MSNTNGFIKLRRGLDEHLDRIDGDALKLYVRLLFRADWRKGRNHGLATGNLSEMAQSFGWSRYKLSRKLGELEGKYVAVEHRGNQFTPSAVRILKYDDGVSVKNAASSTDASRKSAASTDEHAANLLSEGCTGVAASSQKCGKHSREPQESADVKPAEEVLRKEELGESVEPSGKKKAGQPTDRVSLTGSKEKSEEKTVPLGILWATKLGMKKLSAEFTPFLNIVKQNQPRPDETKGRWCQRILDLCTARDVAYPKQFFAVAMRYRKHDEPMFTTTERIVKERKLRGLVARQCPDSIPTASGHAPEQKV